MSAAASRTWLRAFEASQTIYTDVEDWTPNDDRICADRVIQDAYIRKQVRRRSFGPAIRTPDPGRNNLALGTMLELHVWDARRETIVGHRFRRGDAPPLIWSDRLKALYAYPGRSMPRPTVRARNFPRAATLYEEWNDGKSPHGASPYQFPVYRMSSPQIAIAIAYRSDKFHADGDFHEYIHHFEKGVMAYTVAGVIPRAFFVRGGRLCLTPDGLDH